MITMHNPRIVNSASVRQRGTTLLELMVAMALLLVVSAAAFGLFNNMQLANSTQQTQQGLNMALRSAATQLQLDLENAGNGYRLLQGTNIPSWPIGVTIKNNSTGSSCYVSGSYQQSCFDQLNIITADLETYPPLNPTDSSGNLLGTCIQPASTTTTQGTVTVYGIPAASSGLTAAQAAAEFSPQDNLLFMHNGPSGTTITSTTLVSATSSGNVVALTVNQTLPDGSNILAYDPLDIASCDRSTYGGGNQLYPNSPTSSTPSANSCPPYVMGPVTPAQGGPTNPPNILGGSGTGTNFCGASDWIVKLSSIQYYAQQTNAATNTWQLVRSQNGGTPTVVMDQILGFRVGASLWDADSNNFTTPYYNYNASSYYLGNCPGSAPACMQENWNFSLIRSVRISMIARSAPTTSNFGTTGTYHNTFDTGAYQVRGIAIVVNPRNLSMNDN
jgi:prepilin-type N-terminal cleavage/methylation domain-containing protein